MRENARWARERKTPIRMSGKRTPSATLLMISVSARTAQTLEMSFGCSDASALGPISSRGTWRYFEHRSTKRPAPAAHFSFILNLSTFPVAETDIVREACVPTSTTSRVLGKRKTAPRAEDVKSLTCRFRSGIVYRPKPVVQRYSTSSGAMFAASSSSSITCRAACTGMPRDGAEVVARIRRPSSSNTPLTTPAPRSSPPVITMRPPPLRVRARGAPPPAPQGIGREGSR